jgi:CubicO group peptidase (beta-lactamase class C family)
VVLVARDSEVLYERALGAADDRDERPLDVDTAFYLASVSKQFTALGALILVDEGKLSYDDELTGFFPELAFAKGVTIQHLLTHTSGVPDHYKLLDAAPDGLTNEQVVELLASQGELDFEPGTAYSYSNGAYVLLSLIVGQAAEQPFADFMAERVFEPLGMGRTLVYDEREPDVGARAVGFAADGSLDDYTLYTTGAGGMYSTVGDLALWDAALRDGRLVKAETLGRAYTPVRLADGSIRPYGFGWQLAQTPDGRVVHHGGGMAGFRTSIVRNIDNGTTLILLTNHGADAMIGAITVAAGAILNGMDPRLPTIPGAVALRRLIETEGLAAALASYDGFLAAPAAPAAPYDLDENQLNQLGYEYLQAGHIDVSLALFKKNVEVFPDSSNTHDSLGEARAHQPATGFSPRH